MYEGDVPPSGKLVVIGLLMFAALLATTNVYYHKRHVKPFRELQLALDREFPGAFVRVEGGQVSMAKQTPKMLRISMFVNFNGRAKSQVESHLDTVIHLARKHGKLEDYENLEIHLQFTKDKLEPGGDWPRETATQTKLIPVTDVLRP